MVAFSATVRTPLIRGAVFTLGLLGCSNFLEVEQYDLLPPFQNLDFAAVTPSTAFELWELRAGWEGAPHQVLARGGTVDRGAIAPALRAQFDGTEASTGFDPACLPAYCYKYLVSLSGTTIRTWTTFQEAQAFLGTIDNRVEAAILAKADGFFWETPKETAAIRDLPDGYELALLRLVNFCAPIRYDRFRIRIHASGSLILVKRELWRERKNECF